MKEDTITKIISNPFRDILDNELVTKAKSGIADFVSDVKNLFRPMTGSGENNSHADVNNINNYLKTPEEIEAEIRFICSTQEETALNITQTALDKNPPQWKGYHETVFLNLEETLSGDMEENY